jgi:hypothetical protein
VFALILLQKVDVMCPIKQEKGCSVGVETYSGDIHPHVDGESTRYERGGEIYSLPNMSFNATSKATSAPTHIHRSLSPCPRLAAHYNISPSTQAGSNYDVSQHGARRRQHLARLTRCGITTPPPPPSMPLPPYVPLPPPPPSLPLLLTYCRPHPSNAEILDRNEDVQKPEVFSRCFRFASPFTTIHGPTSDDNSVYNQASLSHHVTMPKSSVMAAATPVPYASSCARFQSNNSGRHTMRFSGSYFMRSSLTDAITSKSGTQYFGSAIDGTSRAPATQTFVLPPT